MFEQLYEELQVKYDLDPNETEMVIEFFDSIDRVLPIKMARKLVESAIEIFIISTR